MSNVTSKQPTNYSGALFDGAEHIVQCLLQVNIMNTLKHLHSQQIAKE